MLYSLPHHPSPLIQDHCLARSDSRPRSSLSSHERRPAALRGEARELLQRQPLEGSRRPASTPLVAPLAASLLRTTHTQAGERTPGVMTPWEQPASAAFPTRAGEATLREDLGHSWSPPIAAFRARAGARGTRRGTLGWGGGASPRRLGGLAAA